MPTDPHDVCPLCNDPGWDGNVCRKRREPAYIIGLERDLAVMSAERDRFRGIIARNGNRFVVYNPPDSRDDTEHHECLLCGAESDALRTLVHFEHCPVAVARSAEDRHAD